MATNIFFHKTNPNFVSGATFSWCSSGSDLTRIYTKKAWNLIFACFITSRL